MAVGCAGGCVCCTCRSFASIYCCVGQYAYNRFERWRLAKAVELHYPELAPTADKETREEKSFQSSFVSQTIHPTQIHT